MTAPAPKPQPQPQPQPIDDYLRALGHALPVSSRVRNQILDEVADGLHCATAEHVRGGDKLDTAARAAVEDFGDPRQLASEFARQLAGSSSRRAGVGLVTTGPIVGLIWAAAYGDGVTDWASKVAGLLSTVPVVPLILLVAVPAAILAIRTADPARRSAAAMLAAAGTLAGDAVLIGAFVGHRPTVPALSGLLLAAVGISVIRAATSAVLLGRIARLRAASY